MITIDTTRYERNILIPEIGLEGQRALNQAKVAVVGLGGLGSPVTFYLTAGGIGTIGLFDYDVVELSNLQRQILHNSDRLGVGKTESAAATLLALNPDTSFRLSNERITADNAPGLLDDYDVIVEATDNFRAKYLLNDYCVERRKPLATAGILGLSGQMMFIVPGSTPCLRCLVPEPPLDVPSTSQLGVLGAVPGLLGSLETLAVIRWLVGMRDDPLAGRGRLHSFDGSAMRLRTLNVERRVGCLCDAAVQKVKEGAQ
ncbi:MAG: hypothetical protein AUK47_28255 [Deltaproteobacteria bacterium CG2_30_63_29]|nr:MAG: hypothetical protein AUK47_28255 [Deltaproteobacteria bacterium CG2_30_63_29]PIW01408.1 MAG: adenylyltransferase [Deltaproteobacteria bacterium CG17_big_fil_post_rev_8_21_14_2_50_63_7]PJB48226.1 MAG: adenylyltransferase [Deltaproteobacteria bacterium CG_4_9_14_3_um_filter_63_12]